MPHPHDSPQPRQPRATALLLLVALAAAALALCSGCGKAAQPRTAVDFDRPVPASEPRKRLRLRIDLEPSQDCEERFDLALYRDRRIDLISWDDSAGSCIGRIVEIRYLSAKLTSAELLEQVRKLARNAATTNEAR